MRKSLVALSLAGLGCVSGAYAQSAAPASPHTFTANVGVFSDYRFRGISQTFHKPALQGGFDYSHASGLYLGNWNSNVSEGAGYPGANLEMDFYGGWKGSWGDFGLDVGALYYYYPGSDAGAGIAFSPANNRSGAVHSGRVDNKEVYVGGSWKFLSLKYYHSVDDYFSTPGTKNSYYVDLAASYDLGGGWGVIGHVGRLKFKNMDNADYTDWKVGVTKDLGGWLLGAAYVDTNAKGDCGQAQFYCFANSSGTKTKDAGKGTVVLSVSRTF